MMELDDRLFLDGFARIAFEMQRDLRLVEAARVEAFYLDEATSGAWPQQDGFDRGAVSAMRAAFGE